MLAAATVAAVLSILGVTPLLLQSFHLWDTLYLRGCATRSVARTSCVFVVLKKANTWRSDVTEVALCRLVNTHRQSMKSQVCGKGAVVNLLPIRVYVRQECSD